MRTLAMPQTYSPRDAQLPAVDVLIIDSELARRTRVAETFRAQGCHVVEASDGSEALALLETMPRAPAVIAVADTLPEAAGIELGSYLDVVEHDALVISVGDPEWVPSRLRIDPSEGDALLAEQVRAVLQLRSPASSLGPVGTSGATT